MPRSRHLAPHYDTTGPQLAGRLGCNAATIRRLYNDGLIPGIRLGRELRFNYAEVVAALEAADHREAAAQ